MSEPWLEHGLELKHYNLILLNIAQTLYDRGLHSIGEEEQEEEKEPEEPETELQPPPLPEVSAGSTGTIKKPARKVRHKKTIEGSYSIMAQFLTPENQKVDAVMVGRVGKAVGVGDIRSCFGTYARPRGLAHLIIIAVGKVTPLGKL